MGPLGGLRVVELAGIGPAPMCAMLMADLGADVIRVDRTAGSGLGLKREPRFDLLNRGRPSIGVDLKHPDGRETVLRLVEQADVLIEGFRPGVTERLGIGPDDCAARNPKLVYGRMTGWGQAGPIAAAAGHDINYIALTGALHAIGTADAPLHPLNLVGDFGGGALYLAFGLLAAVIEARESGTGQTVDCAMTDGAASLMTMFYGMHAAGTWRDERGVNAVDGGSHFYRTYETADGEHVAIGSIEDKFYRELLEKTGLDAANDLPGQHDADSWAAMSERLATIFKTKTRDEWCAIMEGSDVCFAPVLSLAEAPRHPQNKARATFIEIDGVVQPAPAPRFSRTPGAVRQPPSQPAADTDAALAAWGWSEADIAALHAAGAIRQAGSG